jgi:hypothetical protein
VWRGWGSAPAVARRGGLVARNVLSYSAPKAHPRLRHRCVERSRKDMDSILSLDRQVKVCAFPAPDDRTLEGRVVGCSVGDLTAAGGQSAHRHSPHSHCPSPLLMRRLCVQHQVIFYALQRRLTVPKALRDSCADPEGTNAIAALRHRDSCPYRVGLMVGPLDGALEGRRVVGALTRPSQSFNPGWLLWDRPGWPAHPRGQATLFSTRGVVTMKIVVTIVVKIVMR